MTQSENKGGRIRKWTLEALRVCKNPLYYWYTGNRRVAVSTWVIDALVVALILLVIPVLLFGTPLWLVILAVLPGFVLQEALLGVLLLLGLLYLVAPWPVGAILGFIPVGLLVLGAVWGAVQNRLLAGYLFRRHERKAAQSASS